MNRGEVASRKLDEARTLDGEIRELHRQRNRIAIEIAERLERMENRGLASALGFESVAAYAWRTLGYSVSKTRALVGIARGLRELPAVRAAAVAGELAWTKLRHIVGVATRETEGEWLDRARRMNSRELERAVAEERGEELKQTLQLELTPGQAADIEEAVRAVWKEQPELSFGAAVAEACRRAVAGAGAAGGSRYRVVVTTCAECGRASRDARDGAVPVEKRELERVACDAEILDVRQGPAPIRRAMPPKVARFIDARDGGRCRVPGCSNRAFIERHHEGGWRQVGHAPARAFLLCSLCRIRHKLHYADSRIMPRRATSPELSGLPDAA